MSVRWLLLSSFPKYGRETPNYKQYGYNIICSGKDRYRIILGQTLKKMDYIKVDKIVYDISTYKDGNTKYIALLL